MKFGLSPQSRIFIVTLCIVGIGVYVAISTAEQPAVLPQNFLQAREEASEISRRLVALTSMSASLVGRINLSGLGADADTATALIGEARENNMQAHQSAFELSEALRELSTSLESFSSRRAQQLAYEAVATELSLVAEFITYTERFNAFLDILSRAVLTNVASDREAAARLLTPVNESVKNINQLNQAFIETMRRLDAAL